MSHPVPDDFSFDHVYEAFRDVCYLAGIKAILVDPVNIDTDVKWTKFTRKLFKDRRNK